MAVRDSSPIVGSLVAGILVLGLLYYAQSIFVPLVFSLFIIALVWPVQALLQQWMPKLLALLFTLSVTIFVIIAVGSSVAWGMSKLGQWLFANAGRYQEIYADWTEWLEEHGIAVAGPIADRFDVNWLVGFTQELAGRVNSFAGFALLVFVFVMLGLLEVEDFNRRLASPGAQPHGVRVLSANREIGAKLRRFMVVRTFASLLTGFVVWAFALFAGLELAAAWGAIAFALNYIPFLGPFVATAFPTLFAIAQFESWQSAILVFIGLNLIQFIIGSYLEPLLTGASLAISPFAVIFSVFFWSFMWGVSGAFIGVPILIAFIVYCSLASSSTWLVTLLSGGPSGKFAAGP
ncbi:AI-2E family transporter [Rhizobiaceae bacterium n13]|uniref:AI-2E family transporter n=1 Tax=Ferirhizobium litorale TaxID=2927786 RepID=A0AAE3U174_9HYPH|nr:AI-2E family transporter [Fererhizobium litorale]MDI7861612.1 AI-2E family transporter [Fererhizobium litorale]MDI7922046.1 AI-2E family transporter [Fererhizobium litorale]